MNFCDGRARYNYIKRIKLEKYCVLKCKIWEATVSDQRNL